MCEVIGSRLTQNIFGQKQCGGSLRNRPGIVDLAVA